MTAVAKPKRLRIPGGWRAVAKDDPLRPGDKTCRAGDAGWFWIAAWGIPKVPGIRYIRKVNSGHKEKGDGCKNSTQEM
jgi:hypothetical protein